MGYFTLLLQLKETKGKNVLMCVSHKTRSCGISSKVPDIRLTGQFMCYVTYMLSTFYPIMYFGQLQNLGNTALVIV